MYVWGSPALEDSPVVPDAHGAEANVYIREADAEEAAPGPEHVSLVEAGDATVGFLAGGRFGDFVFGAADEMAEGMAAKCVAGKEKDVEGQDKRAQADAEVFFAV